MPPEFDIDNLWPKLSDEAKKRWMKETKWLALPASKELEQAMLEHVVAAYLEIDEPR